MRATLHNINTKSNKIISGGQTGVDRAEDWANAKLD
jgi:hypothetical protein